MFISFNVSHFSFSLVILLGQMFGQRDTASLLDVRVVKVPIETLRQRLAHIPHTANYPWLTNQSVHLFLFYYYNLFRYYKIIVRM